MLKIVLTGLLQTGEHGAEAAASSGINVTLIFGIVLVVGVALAGILYLLSTFGWDKILSNTDRQMFLNAGMIAAVLLLLVGYTAYEPTRLASAQARQQHEAVERGLHSYATYCVNCHGNQGQGGPVAPSLVSGELAGTTFVAPPVNRADFRPGTAEEMAAMADFIRKTVARGRPHTPMPAWAVEEGGGLISEQIEDLVTFIQHGDFSEVDAAMTPEQKAEYAKTQTEAGGAQPTAEAGPGGPGKALFVAKGCAGCHTIQGVSSGTVGPNLTNIASKENIAGVLSPVNQENMEAWISDPPAHKPGTAMPKLPLTPDEIKQLAEYMITLK